MPTDLVVDLDNDHRVAAEWLFHNNFWYQHYYLELAQFLASRPEKYYIATSRLLLHMPGIECAAFPLLYPRHQFAETDFDHRKRCEEHDERRIPEQLKKSLWSIGRSYLRKAFSRCKSYERRFKLYFLLHDIVKARRIMAALTKAQQLGSNINSFQT